MAAVNRNLRPPSIGLGGRLRRNPHLVIGVVIIPRLAGSNAVLVHIKRREVAESRRPNQHVYDLAQVVVNGYIS